MGSSNNRGVIVRPVRTAGEFKDFLFLPWRIYKGDQNWVPPLIYYEKRLLDRSVHPFHHHAEVEYFIAYQDKERVGRIAAIIDHLHNQYHREQTGFFGFFECVHDVYVVQAMFERVEGWLKERGIKLCRGPCSFSTNQTCGLLVEGFDLPPFVMMSYNPSYYPGLIEGLGYQKVMDMYAYFLQTTEVLKGKLEAVAASCASRYGVRLRQADMRRFDRELGIFMEIYNKAWGQNWGFVPMTQEEIAWTARELRSIVLPEFAYIAEVGSKPVGFAIGIPDINQVQKRLNGRLFPLGWLYLVLAKRRIRYLRIFALGVLPEYQHMGIGSILYLEFIKEGIRRGYKGAELSWVLETNQRMNKPLLSMGAKPYKVYRIYQKALP